MYQDFLNSPLGFLGIIFILKHNMKRIGILGGSFNPPHNGHAMIARGSKFYCDLDEVWFLPSYNPLKDSSEYVSDKDRVNMLNLMIKSFFRGSLSYKVCDYCLQRGGPSYAYDILKELQSFNIKDEFYFIIGSDSFFDLRKWKNWKGLLREFNLIVCTRPGYDLFYSPSYLKKFVKDNPEVKSNLIFPNDFEIPEISSTEIRNNIKDPEKVAKNYFPITDNVMLYIINNKLYK